MKKENWKKTIHSDDYEVSDLGRVRSFRVDKINGRILRTRINENGYVLVELYITGHKRITKKVHQLVAESFLNHIVGKSNVVNHKDFNRQNNRLINLELTTQRENTNRKHLKSSSQYVGVTWDKGGKKWRAAIRINNKTLHLGSFINELDASVAYQNKLTELNKK